MRVIDRNLILGGQADSDLKLGFVNDRLRNALDEAGYVESTYYRIPKGFALITRLEQIELNGHSKPLPARWSSQPSRISPFDLAVYIRALFTADPGYYRVIAILVTGQSFAQSGRRLGYEETVGLSLGGGNALPSETAEMPYLPPVQCTALIYEFERPRGTTSNPDGWLLVPSRLDALTHLTGSGLLAALTRNARTP